MKLVLLSILAINLAINAVMGNIYLALCGYIKVPQYITYDLSTHMHTPTHPITEQNVERYVTVF